MVMSPIPQSNQLPASYTGGEAMPQAVESVSNLRTIIQKIYDRAAVLDTTTPVEIPKVGYGKTYRVVLTGTLQNTLNTGTITAADPRKLLRNVAFSVQGATRMHTVPGIVENIINAVDNQVLNNKQSFSAAAGAQPFYLEFDVNLPFTEANLGGVVYKGGGSTYPTLDVTLGPVSDIVTLTGNATSVFSSLTLKVYEERIDAEAPRNPERVQVMQNGQTVDQYIPGRGLWEETSQFIQTFVDRREDVSAANQYIPVDMQLGLPYLRIFLFSFLNNQLDANDTLLNGYTIRLENTTDMWDFDLDLSDILWRRLFYKQRPGGVHVLSFIDRTASDRDILYSRDLGRLELGLKTGPAAVSGPGNYILVVPQVIVPLEAAAMY